jgi:hypothetical protein
MSKKKSYSISYGLLGYQPRKEPENTPLNPPSGGSGVQHPLTLNGEPLSTKQLHEVIISQSMTIDRLLGEVGRYRAAMEQMRKQYKKGHYIIQVTPEIAKVLNEIP